jgi:hypothetical protein
MDWEGLKTAYLDRERQRLGLPSRMELETKRAEMDRAAAESASGLETEAVGRDLNRARIAAMPGEQDLERRLREAQIRNYDEPPRQPAQASSLLERLMAMSPEDQKRALALHRQMNPPTPRGEDRVLVKVQTGVDAEGRPQFTYVPRSEAAGMTATGSPSAGAMALRLSRQRAAPVLNDLGSRVMTLNQGSEGGFGARAVGAARGAASAVGVDPAVDLYRTGVRGFVPLFARSVGHVGVLTELDVQRTEDLFPRVGDAEDVTAEKLARLNRIMTGQEPAPFEFEHPEYTDRGITSAPGTGAPPPTGGVKIQRNKRTGEVRHSLDGGATWQPGPPPQ